MVSRRLFSSRIEFLIEETSVADVARFYARVLLHGEDPTAVKKDVCDFKSEYQTIRYCFNEDGVTGYPL